MPMNEYLNFFKKNKIFTLAIILIILIIILVIINILIFNHSSFTIDNETIHKNNDNYNMQINYPVFSNNEINKKINKIIDEEKDKFLKKIDKKSNEKNELNIDYNYTIKNDIYSIQIRSYSYTGLNRDFYFNDLMLYINSKDNTELTINDLIDQELYNVLKDKCYQYLKDKEQDLNLYDDNMIKDYLADFGKDILLSFSEDELNIIIPPFKVSDDETDFRIPLTYDDTSQFLNNKYFTFPQVEEQQPPIQAPSTPRDESFFQDKKLVALTFDDGPNYKVTTFLLDELDNKNAKASFFLVGSRISSQKVLIKRMYNSGHSVGSHSYNHKNLTKLTDEQLMKEINDTNELISQITGEDVKYLRPPYGSYNKDLLNKINMTFILWNVDTLDWQSRDSQKVCDSIINSAKDGAIILLHDLYQTSVDGALCAIDKLQEQGYAFVSIDEMIKLKNIDLKTNTAYRYFK